MGDISTQAQAVLTIGGIAVVVLGLALWIWAIERGWPVAWRGHPGGPPHFVEARKRARRDGWAVRCSRCGWLPDVPSRHDAFRVVNAHHAAYGGGTFVRTDRRWWR